MLLQKEAVSLLFENNHPAGVVLDDGQTLKADNIIYSGTVWNLYGKLIGSEYTSEKRRNWAKSQLPTYPSSVLYAVVDRSVIPEDTCPIEMLVGNPDRLDENEVTAYMLSIDDRTLCGEDEHTITAIGPSFENWNTETDMAYKAMKEKEQNRLIDVMEKRFPGFRKALRYAEIATPRTIERYTLKNGGAVAGPKQMLGQHMFRRQHTRTEWDSLYCCGESTVMGTGTPTVTTSGLSAANALLKKLGKEPYVYHKGMKNYVNIADRPYTSGQMYSNCDAKAGEVMREARRCRFCEHPTCSDKSNIRGIMRRTAVGNFAGAKKCLLKSPADSKALQQYEENCICKIETGRAVEISKVIGYIEDIV